MDHGLWYLHKIARREGVLSKEHEEAEEVADAVILEEDRVRRRFILRILLVGSLVLVGMAMLSSALQLLRLGEAYRGSNPLVLLPIALLFIVLYWMSTRFVSAASYIFTGLYYLLGTFVFYQWGTSIPQGLLMYVLVIIMSGVLNGNGSALVATVIVSLTLAVLNYLTSQGVITPDLYWIGEKTKMGDVMVFAFSYLIIFFVSWLSNKEIEKSLRRARVSEIALKQERDQLEGKVRERTRELQESQQKEISQLYHLAEFGKLSSELLHDLVDPLAAVSLNLQKLTKREQSTMLQRAIDGTKSMELFVKGARKQLQKQRQTARFSMKQEVEEVLRVFQTKAHRAGVQLYFRGTAAFWVYADPIRFHKLVSNLLSNAIDSFDEKPKGTKQRVVISLVQSGDGIMLTVEDNGEGMSPEQVEQACEPFFTTKNINKGIGLGLSICKEIVEEDFDGTLTIQSKPKTGTTVIARLLRGLAKSDDYATSQ